MRSHPIAIARLTIVLAILAASAAAFAQPAGTLPGSLFDQTGGRLRTQQWNFVPRRS